MLPSRGLLRLHPALGLTKSALQNSTASTRQLSRHAVRQFGTTLRSNGNPTLVARQSLSGRRIGAPVAISATLLSARFPASARYASTQPTVPAPPASSELASATDLGTSFENLTGSQLLDIPEKIGFLKELGLEYGYGPTSMMEWITENIYLYTGLPWWATITAVAVAIRLALLKPSITAAEHQGKLQQLNRDPRYTAIVQRFRDSAFGPNKDQTAMMMARQEKSLMERQVGLKQWKVFVPMLQLPLAIGMFRLLRDMAALPVPSLESGGLLWFTDLTVADPYFALPIAGAAMFYQVLKVGAPYLPEAQGKIMGMVGIVMVPISLLVTAWLPATVQLYILVSGALQLVQTWCLHKNWIRRPLGLVPLVPTAEAAKATSSPSWQPPRTLNTTAQPATAAKNSSPLTTLKTGMSSAREKIGDYTGKKAKEAEINKAQKYEDKRSLQENEQYYARREEKAARRAEKRRRV
ncbi:hypothetical protein GQ53DRAFT_722074 [Thozetella sp. PMI_491]|nr:hypothetical protein GQ53DRAFT_722074 [Thozetella sp. PMI_491]